MSEVEKKRILLVEDEAIIALATSATIAGWGFEVAVAHSGEKAVEMAAGSAKPDLIIMDIDLGRGLSGSEAAARILAARKVPIVFLTSHSERKMVEKVRGLTRYGYVIKNSGDFVLHSSIDMALELFEAHESVESKMEALKESERRFRTLFEESIDAMFLVDLASGEYLDANIASEALTGRTVAELRRMKTSELTPEGSVERLRKSAAASVPCELGEVQYMRPDGSTRTALLNTVPTGDGRAFGIAHDITASRDTESQLRRIVEILKHPSSSIQEFLDHALEQVIFLTRSAIGYIFIYSEDKEEFVLNAWSRGVLPECDVVDKKTTYALAATGIWGEAVRQRRPILVNDFQAAHPWKRGYPEGHPRLEKYMTVPVFKDAGIVAVVGLANKESDYTETDTLQVSLIMEAVWEAVERRRAEDTLRESGERFESLVRDIQVGVLLQGPGAEIVLSNPKALELLGLSEDQLLGKTSFDPDWNVIHEDGSDFPGSTHPVPAAVASRAPVRDVVMGVFRPGRGDRVWLSVDAIPLLDPEGAIRHVVCSFIDITERKASSSLILRTNTLLKAILESSPEVIVFALDRDFRYLAFNSKHEAAMRQIWGRPIAVGASMLDVLGDDRDRAAARANFDRALAGESFVMMEEWGDPKLSRHFWMDYWAPIRDEGGAVVGLTCYVLNYTDQKLAEDRIKNLLAEKELILKEVHHRIKNNMNTLQSMLSLQSGTMKDSAAVGALEDARNRVQSMMVLYEKLYESANFSEASVGAYLPALVDRIVGNFPLAAQVRVTTRVDDFKLGAKLLQPIGIIVNELVTNAMKHAYAGRDAGLLEVSATLEGGRVALAVWDDGPGIPASVGFECSSGFGLTLVGILTEQLKGSIRIEREAGTRISLEFDIGA